LKNEGDGVVKLRSELDLKDLKQKELLSQIHQSNNKQAEQDKNIKLMQDTNVELKYELDMKNLEIRRLQSELNTKEHSIEILKQKKRSDTEEMQSMFDSQRLNLQNEIKILRDQNEKQCEEFEKL